MIQTPLEVSGALTDHAALAAFLADLEADSSRVRVETVGQTVQGKDVYLVCVGYPVAPPAPEEASTRSLLVSGYQHGPEVAGREGAIRFIRDMAYTTDPAETAYLRDHPVYVLPMINADKAPTGTRGNTNGVDLNRDHLALSQPESRAMQETIRRVRPEIVVDLHENDPFPNDAQLVGVTSPQATSIVREKSDELYLAVADSIMAEGYTYEHFAAGTDVPEIFRNSVGLRNTLAMVMETNGSDGPVEQRLLVHLAVLRGVMKYHAANGASITKALADSRAAAITAGENRDVWWRDGAQSVSPAPYGYRLTDAQFQASKYHLDTYGIQYVQEGANWLVTMAQPQRGLIPFFLDVIGYPYRLPAHPGGERITTAGVVPAYVEPSYPPLWVAPAVGAEYPPLGSAVSYGPVRVGGMEYEVTSVGLFSGGRELAVYIP